MKPRIRRASCRIALTFSAGCVLALGLADAAVARPNAPTFVTPTKITSYTPVAPALPWRDGGGAAGFRVQRAPGICVAGSPYATVGGDLPAAATAFTDLAAPEGTYCYRIEAFDGTAVVSHSHARSVVFDHTAPTQPGPLAAASPTATAPALSWTPSTDAVSGPVHYELTRDGKQIGGPIATTAYTDKVTREGTYVYGVVAIDRAGNRTARSPLLTVVYDPTGLPSAVLRPVATPFVRSHPRVTWTVPPTGVDHFDVLRNGVKVNAKPIHGGRFEDAVVREGTYEYAVVTVDAVGNISAPSPIVTVVVDSTAPEAPSLIDAAPATSGAPMLRWASAIDAPQTVVVKPLRYELFRRDGHRPYASVGSWLDRTRFTSAPLRDGVYRFAIRVTDPAGNVSRRSASTTVLVDRRASTRPKQLALTGNALSWTAPTTRILHVKGYELTRDRKVFARVGRRAVSARVPPTRGRSHRYTVVAIGDGGARGVAAVVLS